MREQQRDGVGGGRRNMEEVDGLAVEHLRVVGERYARAVSAP